LIAYASSFDQIGIFSNNVDDAALLLEIMSGPDEYDSTVSQRVVPSYTKQSQPDKKYRIAYFPEALNHEGLDSEISTSIRNWLIEQQSAGNEVAAVNFDLLDYVVPAYYVLTTAEASSNLSRYDGVKFGYRAREGGLELVEFYERTRSEGFGWEVKRRIMLGTFVLSAGYYDAYFTRAQQVRQLITERLKEVFKNYDFIIMPVSPVTAFRIGEKMDDPIAMYLADIYTVTANLAGIPAISLPLFTHSNGMPFGLQVMANRFDELTLLQFSRQAHAVAAG
jgi:aspartyl-tRNA(Asn)/glutamyl-tRNA(Gln) amidotransferase subunit A